MQSDQSSNHWLYLLGADALLTFHVLVVLFIILGLVLTLIGGRLGWSWVRNPWFRLTHLLAIGVVVVQAWLGRLCPLTIWEMELRAKAGEATYSGSFIGHWLGELLYFEAPWWVFVAAYSAFGALVAASWIWVRPRRFGSNADCRDSSSSRSARTGVESG